MKYLLDTCVISELVKPTPEINVINWIKSQKESNLYISTLTIGELYKGVTKLKDNNRKKKIENWIKKDLESRFNRRIISVDVAIMKKWGILTGGSELKGNPLSVIDSMLAATAIVNNLSLVTRNVKDIKTTGCKYFNPWD